jgi:hypothetical protein
VTAIINELRPGLGWAALAVIGVLVAGAGLMLAVLPFSQQVDIPIDRGDGEIVPTATPYRCATPLANAFRAAPPPPDTGWFAYAPNTGVMISSDHCVDSSRRRLGVGAATTLVGASAAGVAMRRIPTLPAP